MTDPQIPSGWQKRSLGKIASIKIGKTPPRDREEFWDSHKRTQNVWLSIKDMTSRFLFDSAEYITDKAIREINIPVVEKGTILLSFKLTIGKVAIAQRELRTNEAIAAIRILDNNQTDNDFLSYGLSHWNLLQDVDQAIKGTTLNKKKLREIEFILPIKPAEQRKIAEILTTVDDAIEQTEALIRKYQRIKQGLMQDLLTRGVDENGELRPSYEEAPELYRETALGWLPKDWEIKKVDDAFNLILGKMLSKVSKKGINPFPYLANRNVQWDRLDLSDLDWMDFSDAEREKLRLLPEDLLVCEGGEVGRTAIWNNEMENCYFQKAIHRLRSKDRCVLPKFMLRYLRFAAQRGLFTNFTSQTSISHLTQEKLKIFPVISPKVSEQERIIKIFENHDDLLVQEEAALNKFHLLKLGLMQNLLSGKVRVTGMLDS